MLASLLSYITTGLGRDIAIGVAAIGLVVGVYAYGRHEGGNAVRAEVAAVTAKEEARQAKAANDALEAARVRADQAEADSAALQDQVDQLAAEVQARPATTVCSIGAEDAKRLNSIR